MRNFFWGFILIIFGVLFLLDNLGVADFGDIISNYWPALLIIWGIHILFRKRKSSHIEITTEEEESSNDLLHRSTVFGDILIQSSSKNFKGGSISAIFGDCIINLSESTIAEGEHKLKFNSVFGDTKIILPKNCGVSVTASSLIGDINILGEKTKGLFKDLIIKSENYDLSPQKIRLHISQVFGDLEVVQ